MHLVGSITYNTNVSLPIADSLIIVIRYWAINSTITETNRRSQFTYLLLGILYRKFCQQSPISIWYNYINILLKDILPLFWSRGSKDYATDGLGFESERQQKITIVSKPSSASLTPTQLPIQKAQGTHFPVVQRREGSGLDLL